MCKEKKNRYALPVLAALALMLAFPVSAQDWDFFRARDLKKGGERFTTRSGVTHAIHVSICGPAEAFICMRLASANLAVPKGNLPPAWQFEGVRYELIERNAGLLLLGERADGVYVRTRGSGSEAVEFFYSRERGFFAFQWTPEPTEKPVLFISNAKCAPGAAASCREK